MNRRLRWRVVATLVVTFGISIFAWYPWLAERVGLPNPGFMQESRLRLGLDLEGGVHLVMRVNTDDAVLVETRNTAGRLDEALGRHGVTRGAVDVLGPGQFRVTGVAADHRQAFRRVADEVAAGFDGAPGTGGDDVFTMNRQALATLRADTVIQARHAVERRVNALGVAEPLIAIQGAAGDEIQVQLAGINDMDRARAILGATALLEWKVVEQGPMPTREALLSLTGGAVPTGHGDRDGRRGSIPGRGRLAVSCPERFGHHRPRYSQRAADPGREQSAGGGVLADTGRGATVRATDGRPRGTPSRDHPGRTRAVGASDRRPNRRRRGLHPRTLYRGAGSRSLAGAAGGRAAGVDDLSRWRVRRAIARERVNPRRRDGVGGWVGARRRLHAPLLQPRREQRHRVSGREPASAARTHGVLRRRVDRSRGSPGSS